MVYIIFLKSRWFFLNCSSLTYISWAFFDSFTKLKNYYSLCESLIKSFEAPENEKKKATTKYINNSLKKYHRYISWVYQDSWSPAPSAYAERCQTSTMKHFAKIVNGCDYFLTNYFYFHNITLPCSLLHEINVMGFLLIWA